MQIQKINNQTNSKYSRMKVSQSSDNTSFGFKFIVKKNTSEIILKSFEKEFLEMLGSLNKKNPEYLKDTREVTFFPTEMTVWDEKLGTLSYDYGRSRDFTYKYTPYDNTRYKSYYNATIAKNRLPIIGENLKNAFENKKGIDEVKDYIKQKNSELGIDVQFDESDILYTFVNRIPKLKDLIEHIINFTSDRKDDKLSTLVKDDLIDLLEVSFKRGNIESDSFSVGEDNWGRLRGRLLSEYNRLLRRTLKQAPIKNTLTKEQEEIR